MSVMINVKNIVYAVMTDEEENTYDEVKKIAPLMNVNLSAETSVEDLYGDGSTTESVPTTGKTTFEAEVNYFSLESQADLLGHKYDKESGILVEHEDDKAPYVAIGFCIERTNGKNLYYWLYKGRFEEVDVEVQQREDSVTFSTPTLKGTFIYRSDGFKRWTSDEGAATTPVTDALGKVQPPAAPASPGA